jgi:hypothetical protein
MTNLKPIEETISLTALWAVLCTLTPQSCKLLLKGWGIDYSIDELVEETGISKASVKVATSAFNTVLKKGLTWLDQFSQEVSRVLKPGQPTKIQLELTIAAVSFMLAALQPTTIYTGVIEHDDY